MKQLLLILSILFTFNTIAQTPCVGGMADGFPCDGYELLARFTPSQLDSNFANDSWGWTDPQDGKEYAIVGLNNGTAFIDITVPTNPIYLGKLPTQTDNSTWRDVKVYNNHAFIVSEANNHGMQIFDLTLLRDVTSPPETFTNTAFYGGFGNAHNIVINEDTGFAYAVGTGTFNGGPHFINIQDPVNPVAAGGYSLGDYSHDAQVVTYIGPDPDHQGKEILIGSNTDEIVIVDITDKSNPVEISSTEYTDVGYTHQGWFTEDHRYFLLGDEFDEFNVGFNTRTVVFDFSDLDDPMMHFEYFGNTPAVDHNGYVVGDLFYLANYNAGVRIIDISDIDNQNFTEVGFFDTFPDNDIADFDGTWNVYPFFESKVIVISGTEGFTLVRDEDLLSVEDLQQEKFSITPNPATNLIEIRSKNTPTHDVRIYNILGQEVLHKSFNQQPIASLNISALKSGVYLVKINNTTTQKLVVN